MDYLKLLNKIPKNELHNLLEDLVEDGVFDLEGKPKTKETHVGIEIECISVISKLEVIKLLAENNLLDNVDVGDDSSIDYDFDETGYELRLISSEKNLQNNLKKLSKVLKKGKFKVNSSCGLHVHLDMRNRNAEKCYQKLINFQDILFGMVNKSRWNNQYCLYTPNMNDKYRGINFLPMSDLKTIEVRMHHGCVDVNRIYNWVKLLINCINLKYSVKIHSEKEVFKLKRLKPSISFIKKNFNKDWWKNKTKAIDFSDECC